MTTQSIQVSETKEVVGIFDDFAMDYWFDEESKECQDERRPLPSPKSKLQTKQRFSQYIRSIP